MRAPGPAPKTELLPTSVASLLDESADVGDMPLSDIAALRLYGDRELLGAAAALDGGRWRRIAALTAYADELLAQVPPARFATMTAVGVPHAHNCALRLARDLATWAFTDARIGGCMIGYRRNRLVKRDGSATPVAARRLASPAYARRYVRESDSAWNVRRANERLFAQIGLVQGPPDDADREAFLADLDALESGQRARRDAEWDAMFKKKPVDRRAKKAAARSAAAAESVLGRESVVDLLAGHWIVIEGQAMSLRVSCKSVFDVGHGALAVEVLEPATGEPLGRLCTYQDGTPALDQAAALALELSAGCEREVLERANIISTTTFGAGHPVLSGRAPLAPQRIIDWRTDRATALDEREMNDAYWARHGDHWIEATCVFALGSRRWRRLARLFGGGRPLHMT